MPELIAVSRWLYYAALGTACLLFLGYFVGVPLVEEWTRTTKQLRDADAAYDAGLCPRDDGTDDDHLSVVNCNQARYTRASSRTSLFVGNVAARALCIGMRDCYIGPMPVPGVVYRLYFASVVAAAFIGPSGYVFSRMLERVGYVEKQKLPS